MNLHYFNKYTSFLNRVKNRGNSTGLIHKHHIIPRSMGGKDDASNIINLSVREHFIAHWMLAKTYETGKMWLAFRIMCLRFKDASRVTSKMYEVSEKKRIETASGLLDNMVFASNRWITSEEYQANKSQLVHFNSGKITVRNKLTGETSKQPINFDTTIFESIKIGNVNAFDKLTNTFHEVSKEEFHSNKNRYSTINKGVVHCVVIETGEVTTVTKEEYKKHKDIKYRRKDTGLSLTCPHCQKTGGSSMRRWHFNNCKLKEIKNGIV